MADYSILPPGLAGYVMGQEHDQATQANALAQALQGVQIKSALMKQQQDQLNLDRQNRIRNRLTALATGDTGAATAASQEPYGGGYSPDVAKSFGVPAGAPAGASRPQAAPGLGQSLTQNFLRQAQILSEEGDFDNANKLYEHAAKFMPEVKEIRVEMQNGTPVNVITMKDGTQRVSGFSPTPKIHFADDGQRTAIPVDEYTGKPMGQGMQRFQDPNSKASNAVAWFRANQEFGDTSKFTPGAIDNAAARYNIDGTLPPMGMGMMGGQARAKILNRAAELAQASGVSADDQRIAQIGNKANTAAMSKLQQQQTMVGAFERNFVKNADMALDLANKTAIDGVPIVSKWIQSGKRSVAGNPDISAYDVALKATVNEYAKIISGSMGNTAMAEGEIKKVESLLNAAQTPEQVNSVISFMKKETQNRMAGFDDEKKSLQDSMRGKRSVSAPSIQPAEAGKSVIKTGTAPDGRKVVMYSDGSVSYAP